MARIVFWLIVLGTVAYVSILAESENEEIQVLHMHDNDSAFFHNSDGIITLIMIPKIKNVPCDCKFRICGTDLCVFENEGNVEDFDSESQSSITDTNTNQVSWEHKKCMCSRNEPVFITQEVMELLDQHFVAYRVQEESENGCEAVVCDWKLIVYAGIQNEPGGDNDVIGCVIANTCMVVCHVRKFKLLRDVYRFSYLAVTMLLSIMTVLSCIIFNLWLRYERTSTNIHSSKLETKLTKQVVSAGNADETEEIDDEVLYQKCFPIHDGFPEKEPAHLKYRMILQKRQKKPKM